MLLRIVRKIFSLLEVFFYHLSYFLSIPFSSGHDQGVQIKPWTNILHNIFSNEWELKVVHQQRASGGRKLTILFLTNVFPSSLKKNWNRRMVYDLLITLKNSLQYHFTTEKRKISIAIKKNLLNQGYILFVIKSEFLCHHFLIITRFRKLIVNLKDWPFVSPQHMTFLVKIMLTITEESVFTLVNIRVCP